MNNDSLYQRRVKTFGRRKKNNQSSYFDQLRRVSFHAISCSIYHIFFGALIKKGPGNTHIVCGFYDDLLKFDRRYRFNTSNSIFYGKCLHAEQFVSEYKRKLDFVQLIRTNPRHLIFFLLLLQFQTEELMEQISAVKVFRKNY